METDRNDETVHELSQHDKYYARHAVDTAVATRNDCCWSLRGLLKSLHKLSYYMQYTIYLNGFKGFML